MINMEKLAGVKIERDAKGRAKKAIIDLKKHGDFLENFLDHLAIQKAKKGAEFIPWEKAKKELHKTDSPSGK